MVNTGGTDKEQSKPLPLGVKEQSGKDYRESWG